MRHGSLDPRRPPPPPAPGRGRGTSNLPNPGSFDSLHRQCKDVFPVQMEGVKVTVNKELSSHFKASHTVIMSALGLPGYQFSTTYVGSSEWGPGECYPVLLGEMDSSGSLNAQCSHRLTEHIRTKAVFQTQQDRFVNWQLDTEYRGDDFTATLTLGHPNLPNTSGVAVAHFLQSVWGGLALGGELVLHRHAGTHGAILTAAGRYTGENWVATLNVGQGGAHASYYHRANRQVQVGVEFEASTRTRETSCSFAYQLTLPRTSTVFRACADSNWVVGAVLERRLRPLPLTLALGAFLSHRRSRFQCGFSLTAG
ncbi:mitochondrial import receptor subunit TOM40B-like isoform X1 [Petromyzon marinus]|uniref:mitochondrial import receptor subunit TOM40B-like isoform X1 n=1 Tax=Petromyzon marinus TaxID=7757 RepID=UPI003F716B3E